MDFSLLDRLEMRHPEEFDVIRVNLERRRISPKNEYGGIGIAFSRVGSSFVIMQLTAGGSAARSLQVIFACLILISSIHHFCFWSDLFSRSKSEMPLKKSTQQVIVCIRSPEASEVIPAFCINFRDRRQFA